MLGGIGYWADRDHRAFGAELNKIGSAGRDGEAFSLEDGAEDSWVAIELALKVVGDLLAISRNPTRPFEVSSADLHSNPRVCYDVVKPIAGIPAG